MQTEPQETTEPLVTMVERRLGGPVGEHARRVGSWFTAGPWVFLVATISWLLLLARQSLCMQTDVTKGINVYYRLCYTDISILHQNRQLEAGASPYGMEYPVLTGFFIDVTRTIARALGAPAGRGLSPQAALDSANIFFAVNAVALFACFLVTVYAQLRTTRHRPFDALMVAGAPVLVATGLINWDLLCVMLTALGVWQWSRRHEGLAGLFIGLAVAAKLYPLLIFVPLVALALRTGRYRGTAKAILAAVAAWGVPNLLVYLRSPKDWLYFWTFNVDRGGDLGSIWYVLGLMGVKLPTGSVSALQSILMIVGAAAIIALALLAPRRPRLGQLALLMLLWFLIINKVYSPQYVLWLLPFVVLARPRWHDWLVWTLGELAYFAAVWGHLAGTMFAAGSTQDRLYWAAVFIRIGVQVWLGIQVVMDVLQPADDVLRRDGHDDPHGGEFDHARDASWVPAFATMVTGRRAPGEVPAGEIAASLVATDDIAADDTAPRTGSTAATDHRWRIKEPGRFLLQAWLGSRGLLVATAVLCGIAVKGRSVTDIIGNWDVQHFYDIAREGYVDVTDPAFFPGLPMILRAFHTVGISYNVTGLVLSAVCSFLAAVALWRLGGRTAGPWASALWLVAPTAVFTFVPYTESLFCALAFWAWERARAGRWWQMAMLAALACTVRVSGLFLIGALFILILTRGVSAVTDLVGTPERRSTKRVDADRLSIGQVLAPATWLLLPAAALGAYAWFGKIRFGSWMAWYTAQTSGWAREMHMPWESFLNTLPVIVPGGYADHPGWSWIFRGEVISMIVGVVATIILIRRRRWAEASWIAVQVLAFSLSYWWMSVNRAVLLWFPLWLLLGEWVSRREPRPERRRFRAFVVGTGIGTSVIVMCVWAYLFYLGMWAS